jgi:alginate O-acetyltransferase complex protein AlgI
LQFLSPEFGAAFAAAFILYWAAPRAGWQNLLLLCASAGFAGLFGIETVAVLAVSTLAEWAISNRIARTETPRGRKAWLWASILLNLAQLAFFKYSHFFLPQTASLLSGLGLRTDSLRILMPVGLSFWTLQKMTLTLDVYHRRMPAEKNYFRALLFTGFFPTLLSGPIEYSRNLLPQFAKARTWDTARFSGGVWLFAIGAFQKAVIADNVGVLSDALLAPGQGGLAVLAGIWAYALQLYGDFAGYSYMARGCARMLGIDVTQNFLAPYLTTNLSDYWKNWHISLSGWLNENIFTPVSMDLRRWGTGGIVAGIWATFIASGLWHGTGWTFFAYGCFHAAGITVFVLSKDVRKKFKKRFSKARWPEWIAILITFHYVCLGYILFRAPSLAAAWSQIAALSGSGASAAVSHKIDWTTLGLCAFSVFGLQGFIRRDRDVFWIFNRAVWFRVAFYLALGFLLLRFYSPSDRFIYQQF